jgi:nucleotide-binding universal stress UspA family protein
MGYKSILVQAKVEDGADARVACAADLADRFEAVLRGLGAGVITPRGAVAPYNALEAAWSVDARSRLESELRGAETSFRRIAGARRTSWETHCVDPAIALVEASRGADLIVEGGAAEPTRGTLYLADAARVIVTSGRPVLFAPPGGAYCSARQILVAWKDTREARRALADALPFLKRAEDVVVLELCQTADTDGAEHRTREVAEFLARHGIDARAEAEPCDDRDVFEKLEDRAERLGADLVVAGAYGHTRLGEWVFGGVTRALLRQSERFVIFSH